MGVFFPLVFFSLIHCFIPGSGNTISELCGGANFTANSAYASSVNQLVARFASLNTSFATLTAGAAYGLVLCRGDASASDCSVCLQRASQDLGSLCPGSKRATVWYDNCELRYSDARFFSLIDGNTDAQVYTNVANVTDGTQGFIQMQRKLLAAITHDAAYNSSALFATGTAVNGSLLTVNALAQCTRDLSNDSCSQCLQQILDVYRHDYVDLEMAQGGRVYGGSCSFRYEIYPFFQGKPTVFLNFTPAPPPAPPLSPAMIPPPPPAQYSTGSKSNTTKVLSIVIPTVVAAILLIAVCVFFWIKRARKQARRTATLEEIAVIDPLSFDLSTLKAATDNFSKENKLGEGGFGSVFKGKLTGGQEIAVKRLSASSTQGLRELKNEFSLVAKLQHRNLVKLLGICLEEEERLLVYEYVPNRSLDNFLSDPVKHSHLNWEQRFNIIGGIARGLCYLHEESHLKVIHRDLKASNILLDADMNSKISDFGLARLFGGDEIQGSTSLVVGTFGYLAPEYALHGHFSTKVDVYSFGVLALEIVTGKRSNSFYDSECPEDFLTYIWSYWSNGTVLEIVDPTIGSCSNNEVLRCIHVALLCVQEVPDERPPMSSVVTMLHSPSVPLQNPKRPRVFYRMETPSVLSNQTSQLVSGAASVSGSPPVSVVEDFSNISVAELHPR